MPAHTLDTIANALVQGDRPTARRLLREYTATHPEDADAWLSLSGLTEEPADRVECLIRVVELHAATTGVLGGQKRLAGRLRGLAHRFEQPARRSLLRVAAQTAGYALLAAVVVAIALVAGPMALGRRTLIILSGSMEPAMHVGSAAIVQPVPSASVGMGDVIAYLPSRSAPVPLVHRIVSVREEGGVRYVTTRGDANGSDDPDEYALPAHAWRLWYSVPFAGYAIHFAASPAGNLTLIALPLLGLAGLKAWEWAQAWRRARPPRRAARPA